MVMFITLFSYLWILIIGNWRALLSTHLHIYYLCQHCQQVVMMTIVITIWQVMMLMMTGHFSPKLVSKILRAVVQQKPVMKSMKACFPHSLSNSTDISESQIYWAGVKWQIWTQKCSGALHWLQYNSWLLECTLHIIPCRVHVVTVH